MCACMRVCICALRVCLQVFPSPLRSVQTDTLANWNSSFAEVYMASPALPYSHSVRQNGEPQFCGPCKAAAILAAHFWLHGCMHSTCACRRLASSVWCSYVSAPITQHTCACVLCARVTGDLSAWQAVESTRYLTRRSGTGGANGTISEAAEGETDHANGDVHTDEENSAYGPAKAPDSLLNGTGMPVVTAAFGEPQRAGR